MRKKAIPSKASKLPWAEAPMLIKRAMGTAPPTPVHLLDDEDFTGEDHETYAEFLVRSTKVNMQRTQEAFRKDSEANANAKGELKKFHGQVPELLATIGRLPLVLDNDIVDIVQSIKNWVAMCKLNEVTFLDGTVMTSEELRAIITFLKCSIRAHNYGPGAQTSVALAYNASVPLVLRAFKEYQNIPYSSFPRDSSLLHFVDNLMYETMNITEVPDKELLLSVRDTHVLCTNEYIEIRNPALNGLNKHSKFLLTQLWVYRPHLYHEYSIHNPVDWDKPAIPLVPTELFTPVVKAVKRGKIVVDTNADIPWGD